VVNPRITPCEKHKQFLTPVRFAQLKACLYVPASRAKIAKECLCTALSFSWRPWGSLREEGFFTPRTESSLSGI